MEAVTVKFENEFLNKVEKAMQRHNYTTKAEFIREAIREKLDTLQKKEYVLRAVRLYGAGRKKHGKISDKDIHNAREKAVQDIAKELGLE